LEVFGVVSIGKCSRLSSLAGFLVHYKIVLLAYLAAKTALINKLLRMMHTSAVLKLSIIMSVFFYTKFRPLLAYLDL